MDDKKHTYSDGTITSQLKPIVTMLTDALVKDFIPAYRKVEEDIWERTDEDGNVMLVNADQLWKDVHDWLMGLENDMDNESDLLYAKMVTQMIRKNRGWVTLLTNRAKKRLAR
jgi:hypothetical protein